MTTMDVMTEGRMLGPSYAWLWEIKFEFDQRIVQSVYGTGEVETVGRRINTTACHIIAPDEASARLAWWRDHHYDEKAKIVSCECLLKVDMIVDFTRPRY